MPKSGTAGACISYLLPPYTHVGGVEAGEHFAVEVRVWLPGPGGDCLLCLILGPLYHLFGGIDTIVSGMLHGDGAKHEGCDYAQANLTAMRRVRGGRAEVFEEPGDYPHLKLCRRPGYPVG